MSNTEDREIVTNTNPARSQFKPLNRVQQERKDHSKAYLSAVTSYEKDPAYWFDMLCHTKGRGVNKKFAAKTSVYIDKLLELGWEVNFIGKSK